MAFLKQRSDGRIEVCHSVRDQSGKTKRITLLTLSKGQPLEDSHFYKIRERFPNLQLRNWNQPKDEVRQIIHKRWLKTAPVQYDQAKRLEEFKQQYRIKTLQLQGASGEVRLGIGQQRSMLLHHYAGFLTGKTLNELLEIGREAERQANSDTSDEAMKIRRSAGQFVPGKE